MDVNKFTEKLQEALSSAQSKAVHYNHQQVEVEHLLLALIEQERGLAVSLLNKADIDIEDLRRKLQQELDKVPRVSGSGAAPNQVYITGRLNTVLTRAQDESKKLGDEY